MIKIEDEKVKNIDTILSYLDNIVGISNYKNTLKDFMKYVELRHNNKISGDIGNFNIIIRCFENYTEENKIIDLIYKILKFYKIIETGYYELTQLDITKGRLKNITEQMIIISTKIHYNMRSTQEILSEYIKENLNKVFIFVLYDEDKGVFKHSEQILDILDNNFCWNIEAGELTEKEIENYVLEKLKKYNTTISDDCDYLIEKLTKYDIVTIDKEIMYLVVKSIATKTNKITNKFLKEIHREIYIKNKVELHQNKSALNELDNLVGLEQVKEQIHNLLNYIKVNQNRGAPLPCLHMTFNGPVGVGKTTVARLVGKIFTEQHILSDRYNFTEIHARDLVGKYVRLDLKASQRNCKTSRRSVCFLLMKHIPCIMKDRVLSKKPLTL